MTIKNTVLKPVKSLSIIYIQKKNFFYIITRYDHIYIDL